MSARLLDGVAMGRAIRQEVAADVAKLATVGIKPGLAVVLVGEDPASQVYVRSKGKACEEAGMHSVTIRLPDTTSQEELLATIDKLNADPAIHGMLVQLPLPKRMNSDQVLRRIDPRKDVDGFHPENVGKLVTGDPTAFRPATPYGVQQMLIRSGIETKGAHAVIIGRSNIVGKPMANLLIQQGPGGDATVTVCHSRTRDLPAIARQADILIAAIGKAEFVTADMVRPGRGGDRRRHQPGGRREPGKGLPSLRRRGLRAGGRHRLRHHAGARRRGPDDHRHAAEEHPAGRRTDAGRVRPVA